MYRTYIIIIENGQPAKLIVETGLSYPDAYAQAWDYNYPDPFADEFDAPILDGEMDFEECE